VAANSTVFLRYVLVDLADTNQFFYKEDKIS